MRTSFLLATLLLFVSRFTFAQSSETNLTKREDAATPYLIQIYDCDMTMYQKDGFLIFPIKNVPGRSYLAVTPKVHDDVLIQANYEWQKAIKTDKEIVRGLAKIAEFEDRGNIEAMRHWKEKTSKMMISKLDEINALAAAAFVNKTMSQREFVTYYEPSYGAKKKYQSLNEMQLDAPNLCNSRVIN